MVDLFGMDTNLWVAAAAAVQTGIVGAAAIFAYRQVREAQLTREDQARPFVIVDFDMSEPPLIYLTITNIGKTIARRVRIRPTRPWPAPWTPTTSWAMWPSYGCSATRSRPWRRVSRSGSCSTPSRSASRES